MRMMTPFGFSPEVRLAATALFAAAWLAILGVQFARRKRPPTRRNPWAGRASWALIVLFVAFRYLDTPAYRRGNFLGENRWLWLVIVAGPILTVVLFVGFLVRNRTSAAVRANRKAARGDLDGAIADLTALVDRELPAGPRPAAPPPDLASNPYAAPRRADLSAQRKAALAEQLNLLAALVGRRGDWPGALAWLERAEQLGTGHPMVRANRATALVQVGRVAEGVAILEDPCRDAPEGDIVKRFDARHQAAGVLIALGRWGAARAVLDAAEAELGRVHGALGILVKAWRGKLAALRARLAEAEATAAAGAAAPAPDPGA